MSDIGYQINYTHKILRDGREIRLMKLLITGGAGFIDSNLSDHIIGQEYNIKIICV